MTGTFHPLTVSHKRLLSALWFAALALLCVVVMFHKLTMSSAGIFLYMFLPTIAAAVAGSLWGMPILNPGKTDRLGKSLLCGVAVSSEYWLHDLCVTRESWTMELFGDYHPDTMIIRVWMRTAVRKEVTSYGTFLSTLCHEFCHHLDFQLFHFSDSWHTRGFFERAAALYHHARGTPPKRLYWIRMGSHWRIDWGRMRRR